MSFKFRIIIHCHHFRRIIFHQHASKSQIISKQTTYRQINRRLQIYNKIFSARFCSQRRCHGIICTLSKNNFAKWFEFRRTRNPLSLYWSTTFNAVNFLCTCWIQKILFSLPPSNRPPTHPRLSPGFIYVSFPRSLLRNQLVLSVIAREENFLSGRKLVASTTFCCVESRKMCKSDMKPLRSRSTSEVNTAFPTFIPEKAIFSGEGHLKQGQKLSAVSSVIEKPQPKFSQQEAISLRWREKFASSKTSDSELRAWSLLRRFHFVNMLQVVC